MAGEFQELLPFTWRGLHLPVSRISMSLAHDLVEHKYWGVDGGRVEATGVAPIRIAAVIPVVNSIVPGKNEKWTAGGLYPDLLRKFIVEFTKKETGALGHPEFGEIACKPERMEFELNGERQDCTEIQASWVETLDEALVHKIVNRPVTNMEIAIDDLNASMKDLKKLVPGLPEYKDDLDSLLRKVTSYVDIASVLQYRAVGILNRILYQAHRMEVAIERAGSMELAKVTPLRPFTGFASRASSWPAVKALQQIREGAYGLRQKALSSTPLGLYTVPDTTTLAGLIPSLPAGTNVGTLLAMNPELARGPLVPKGTVVRYPLPR